MATIIVSIIVFGLFIAVIANMIIKKIKTGSASSCGACSGCSHAQYCHKK
jgi:putative effector of murein hydrolase